jgi:integrase
MGFIFKDSLGRSKNLYLGYRLADGRWRRVSAKTSDKAAARLMLHGLETAEALASTGTATEEQMRKVMAETIERITGKKTFDPTIEGWLDQWLAGQHGTVGAKTFERYAQVVRDLKETLGIRTAIRLRSLKEEVFTEHRERLLSIGCAPTTVNHAFKTLREIFEAATRARLIESNFARLKPLKAEEPGRQGFSREQVAALLAAAKGDEFGFVLILGFTGQRMRDVARLTWRQVDLQEGLIRFQQKKGDKPLLMPIHAQVLDFLLAHAGDDPDAFVFPTLASKLGPALSKLFTRLMDTARIDSPVVRERTGKRGRTTRELSCHSMRHFFNNQLANGDVSQELRQKLTGHATFRE